MPSSPYTTDPELNGVPAHAPSVARRFWHVGFRRRTQLCGEAFVLPTLLFFAVFKYWPMLWAMGLSLTSYDMVSEPRFVGLENYQSLAADPIFQVTLVNTLVYIGENGRHTFRAKKLGDAAAAGDASPAAAASL